MNRRSFMKKALRALVWLVVLALTAGPAFAGDSQVLPPSMRAAMQLSQRPSGDFRVEMPEISVYQLAGSEVDAKFAAMEAYRSPGETPLENSSPYYYYYEHLDPLPMEIYDLICQVASDPVSTDNIALMLTTVTPSSAEFKLRFCQALYAVCFDHPEFFFLYNRLNMGKMPLDVTWSLQAVNGRYIVFIQMAETYPTFAEDVRRFNEGAAEFLKDIDTRADAYTVAKQLHDRMVESVTYDIALCDNPFAGDISSLGHTAFGALVDNGRGDARYAVCDGISLAYEYLLQQCGIPALFIGGRGGNTAYDMGGHAWNMVDIDNVWYEADVTWDENTVGEEFIDRDAAYYSVWQEMTRDPEYREAITHHLFLISSAGMEHFVPEAKEYQYEFSDGSSLNLVGESFHERDGSGRFTSQDDVRGGVICLAPRAEADYAA